MERSKSTPINQTAQTRPDEIVDELIARIFLGEIKAGEQLQPGRALAEELGVDRTSLRIALRQLTRMHVIRPLQGSGITVLDPAALDARVRSDLAPGRRPAAET